MGLDEVLQLLFIILAVGGGLIAQVIQGKKRAARRAGRPGPPVQGGGVPPAGGPGEDEIARRVRELLERASGRKVQAPSPSAPRAEPPPAPRKAQARPSYSTDTKVRKGFQEEGKAMGGDFRLFPPSGVSEGPGRGGKKRKKKADQVLEPAKEVPEKAPLPWVLTAGKKIDSARLAAFLYSHPELAILGYEILGPPPSIREKPPSWEW